MTDAVQTAPAAGSDVQMPSGTYRIDVVGSSPDAFIEREATIPEVGSLIIGVRPAYEKIYGVKPGQFPARATATDVFITAVGSCMIGAFSRGAEARGLEVLPGRLEAVVQSSTAQEPGGVRFVDKIHVQVHTHFEAAHTETLKRVFQTFERRCWLGQTLVGSRCTVTSELVIGEPAAQR